MPAARNRNGLPGLHAPYCAPACVTCEFKEQDDVEVLVLRQTTTRTSGYHTEARMTRLPFPKGIRLARQASEKK